MNAKEKVSKASSKHVEVGLGFANDEQNVRRWIGFSETIGDFWGKD